MTQTPTTTTPFWTPQNVMGYGLALCGVALGAWSKADNTLTSPTLIAVGLLLAAGMYFVDPVRLSGYVHEVRDAAPGLLPRGAQLNVPQPPDTSVVVERPTAPDVVVPPQADPVVMRARAAPLPTPTAGAPKRRGRRATDAPVPPSATVPTVPHAAPADEGIL